MVQRDLYIPLEPYLWHLLVLFHPSQTHLYTHAGLIYCGLNIMGADNPFALGQTGPAPYRQQVS